MNRFHARLHTRPSAAALATAGLVTAAALAACGTGQISQSADQASAVNGTEGAVGQLALRDVRIQATQSGDYLPPGRTVDLVFVTVNQSTQTSDELTGISTGIGHVSVTGDKELPPGGTLIVGAPTGQDAAAVPARTDLRGVEHANAAAATVTLDKPISNGLTYQFTFDFKQAGSIELQVPISAGVVSAP